MYSADVVAIFASDLMLWKAPDDQQCAGPCCQHRQVTAEHGSHVERFHCKPYRNEQYSRQYQFACLAGVKLPDDDAGRTGSAVTEHPEGEIAVGDERHKSSQQTRVACYQALEKPQDERYPKCHYQLQHQDRERGSSVKGSLVGRLYDHAALIIATCSTAHSVQQADAFCPAKIARGV